LPALLGGSSLGGRFLGHLGLGRGGLGLGSVVSSSLGLGDGSLDVSRALRFLDRGFLRGSGRSTGTTREDRGVLLGLRLQGAREAGGTTIAILPGESHAAATAWADHVVVTGIGHARNLAVAASGDAVIAVGGSWGTIAEIAFAMRLGRPVVVLEDGPEVSGVPRAATPAEAVELVLGRLAR
jgi:hypothetical protein